MSSYHLMDLFPAQGIILDPKPGLIQNDLVVSVHRLPTRLVVLRHTRGS